MIGAIFGDVVGSQYDYRPIKTKDFELFGPKAHYSDDSVMTIAVAGALVEAISLQGCNIKGGLNYEYLAQRARIMMRWLGQSYPQAGYGARFAWWLKQKDEAAINSYGNGAAMRVSACGYAAGSLDEARDMAYAVTVVSHNHKEGLRGAQAAAEAVYLARAQLPLAEIKAYFEATYCDLNFTLDEVRADFGFDASCQGTVPYALRAFLESTSFEDSVRNVISLGGDSDTLGAINGAIAAAYYGVPQKFRVHLLALLDTPLRQILTTAEDFLVKRAQGDNQVTLNPELATFEQMVRLNPERVRAEVKRVLESGQAAERYGHAPF